MSRFLRPAALAAALVFAGCGLPSTGGCTFKSVAGSGTIVTQTRPVTGFTKVSLSGTGQLVIEQSGSESLAITADDNLLPYLTSDVQVGELRLGTKDVNVHPTKPIVYKVSVKSLSQIKIAGSGSVAATGLDGERLAVSLAGSGDIKLAGRTGTLEIDVAGSGGYDGEDMKSRDAKIKIAGSGSALVAASATLDVDVAGAGSVEYIGDPTVTQKILGSGTVHKR